LNISECAFTKDGADNVVVTLYNALAHTTKQYVRVPVKNENYQVTDEKGRVVASEIVPVPAEVLALEFRDSDTQHELVFKASVDKIANYYIKKVDSKESSNGVRVISQPKANAETYDDEETIVQTSVSAKLFNSGSTFS